MLDETTFVAATTDPLAFQATWGPIADASRITLKPYAVAILAIND
jgi:hypothetical protein